MAEAAFERSAEPPEVGRFSGFDHVLFWVGNAKQAASYYITRFGYQPYAYSGLETGNREYTTHVIKMDKIVLAFCSPMSGEEETINAHIKLHGDGVKDVAFTVDDPAGLYEKAISRGAISVRAPEELKDENGTVTVASIQTYGETIHTFVNRDNFTGHFLPGFKAVTEDDPINSLFEPMNLLYIDHVVGNQAEGDMEPTADWYTKMLDFHRFWSVDENVMHTEFSALRSVVVADWDETVKMPINEPAPGKRKSQIQEYVDYYAGAGVQHIALRTEDIITTVRLLKARGVKFLDINDTYYEMLKKRLEASPIDVAEDLAVIQELKILVDFDDKGYLLQLFTKPVEDRPTLFFEIIQRRNNQGFGVGNFKALFESIELEQQRRNNL